MTEQARLPNADHAIIDKRKISEYLLSKSHPFGRSKAEFFSRFGFNVNIWQDLERALLTHANNHSCTEVEKTRFGKKYIINGKIVTPDGRNPAITSVWFVERDESRPRFVTAYPLKVTSND